MPIYEYRCEFGHVTEVFTHNTKREYETGANSIPCDGCGATRDAARIFSRTSWQFGDGPKESNISRAIRNVKRAEAEGRIDPPRPGERVSR